MNRNEFLRACSSGLCACVGAGAIGEASSPGAAASPTEDWRLRFVQRRYAKLIGVLSEKMNEAAVSATLHELGRYCASTNGRLAEFRGDLEGYRALIKRSVSGDDVSFDQEKGIIGVTSPERADCFCPLISVSEHTPEVACNCSLGWHSETWETVTSRKVEVELKESVLRGGKRCVFEVRIRKEDAPGAA